MERNNKSNSSSLIGIRLFAAIAGLVLGIFGKKIYDEVTEKEEATKEKEKVKQVIIESKINKFYSRRKENYND